MNNYKSIDFGALNIGSLFKFFGHTESSCFFLSSETYIKVSNETNEINAFCLDDGLSYILSKTDPCTEVFDVHVLR